MAITLPDVTAQNASIQAIADRLDSGAGNPKVVIGTAGMATVLAEIPLNKGPTVTGGGWTYTPVSASTAATGTGTAAAAQYRTSDDTVILDGLTVTLTSGGGDIELASLGITPGLGVQVPTYAYSYP